MPLYEYQCDACGHRFEKIQKFSDPLVDTCPSCGKGPVKKLPSSPAIQFKGSGWYVTDYAKKSSTDSGKSDKSDKSETTPSKPASDSSSSSSSASTSDTSTAKTTSSKD